MSIESESATLDKMLVNVQPKDYELAKRYLLKHEAHDIIEMLGL